MSDEPPVPKRGAFPTPKDVREKAPRYIPDDTKNRPREHTQLNGDRNDANDENTEQK
jgi:hypothetical protein